MRIFENISPMLLNEIHTPFDSEDYFFEVKLDGARTIAHISKERVYLQNKRFVDITDTYPELKNINKQINGECILDGELVILDEQGKPIFEGLQKRAHIKAFHKIKRISQELPAKFVAFDILYLNGEDLTSLPMIARRKILQNILTPDNHIEISQGIQGKGISLFNIVKQYNMEGIVAKKINSPYIIGKRTSHWLKIKNWIDEDFVIVGIVYKDNEPKDLLLGQYKDNSLVLRASIYFSFNKFCMKTIIDFSKNNALSSPPYKYSIIDINKDSVQFLEPYLVCTVEYMLLTKNLGMRQPIFRGLREDKAPKDCLLPKAFYKKII